MRDEIKRFSEEMERVLQEHDENKGEQGWLDDSLVYLWDRAAEEFEELDANLTNWFDKNITQESVSYHEDLMDDISDEEARIIKREAIDVSNLMMMICEKVDSLRKQSYDVLLKTRETIKKLLDSYLFELWDNTTKDEFISKIEELKNTDSHIEDIRVFCYGKSPYECEVKVFIKLFDDDDYHKIKYQWNYDK